MLRAFDLKHPFQDSSSMPCPCMCLRYVYVGMHADGPTRVLCFSEAPDEYAHGSSGSGSDTLSVLRARLARAKQRIEVSSAAIQDNSISKACTLACPN